MIYNPYEILGVSEEATLEELEKRYQEIQVRNRLNLHPTHEDIKKMNEINVAYRNVKDMIKSKELEAVGLPSEEEIKAREAKEREEARAEFEAEREKERLEESFTHKMGPYFHLFTKYDSIVKFHNFIVNESPSKKYQNNFLARVDEIIKKYYIDEVDKHQEEANAVKDYMSVVFPDEDDDVLITHIRNQSPELERLYTAADKYVSIINKCDANFVLVLESQLDKIFAEELTAEARSCSDFNSFAISGPKVLFGEGLLNPRYYVRRWLDLDDKIKEAYNDARAKFMFEHGIDEEAMKNIDMLAHAKLAKYIKDNKIPSKEINEKINELYALDNECFKEIYANYMLDSEENNLKR